MKDENTPWNWPALSGALVVGLVFGYLVGQGSAPLPAPLNPQTRALDADLWVQTSAEYDACCLQTYRFAAERLKQLLAQSPKGGLPPAIIADLDETVLDNSSFQTWMYRYAVAYDQKYWDRWEEGYPDEVRLVPGAGEFLRDAEAAGVTVFYVTNRNQRTADVTRQAMERLGINTKDFAQRFFGASEKTGSDKTSRRDEIRKKHHVLMLLGDNLRDFSEQFRVPREVPKDAVGLLEAIADRRRAVEVEKDKFGSEWIIFPNPLYGEWPKLQGKNPLEVLRPSKMTGPKAVQ